MKIRLAVGECFQCQVKERLTVGRRSFLSLRVQRPGEANLSKRNLVENKMPAILKSCRKTFVKLENWVGLLNSFLARWRTSSNFSQ